jgi:DNA primase
MKISPEIFIVWCESRFEDVLIQGNEVRLNTVFPTPSGREDRDHSLWCNPSGGKQHIDCGIFHCFKSDQHGSLISLIQVVDNCDYETALETLGGENAALKDLERKLKEFFDKKSQPKEEEDEEPVTALALPPYTSLISDLSAFNFHRVHAEVYLFNRKLPVDGLMICTGGGQFRQRIIIPYYDQTGELIYFNGRYIGNLPNVGKYKGPNKNLGIGKSDVLYLPFWPSQESKIYLTEGEFDALSIYYSGKNTEHELYAGAFGGKSLSEKQVEMIRHYRPVLCLDTDRAGKEGLTKMAQILRSKGLTPTFVRPPKIYKDWNAMLQKVGSEGLVYYILKNEKPLDDLALMRLLS